MPAGAAPGGETFTVRLAGRGALRALGLEIESGTAPAANLPAGGVREGKVLAVFRRSFYLSFVGRPAPGGPDEENALACLGPESIGAGPLNLICDLPGGVDWEASGLRPGDRAYVSGGRVAAGRFSFSFEAADAWRPGGSPGAGPHGAGPPGAGLPGKLRREDLLAGLEALAALAAEMAPEEGLGRLIPEMAGFCRVERAPGGAADAGDGAGGADDAARAAESGGDMGLTEGCQTANAAKRQVIRAGGRGARALAGWMCGMLHLSPPGRTRPGRTRPGREIEISSYLTAAAGLVGLGPGLTPSGDDFIGGAMVALRALGRGVIADRLAEWALPLAAAGTSRISRAHLAEAARGEGAGALHEMIEIISWPAGGGILSRLEAIDAVGHTSGWDALAGAAAALSAVFRDDMGSDDIGAESRWEDNS